MNSPVFTNCPRCDEKVQDGFASKSSGLSFVAQGKFAKFSFVDEDVSGAGLSKYLPWKAEYFDSYLCRGCGLYVIDFSKTLSRSDVEDLIKERENSNS